MMRRSIVIVALLILTLTMTGCSKPLKTDAPVTAFCFSHTGMHTGLIYTLSAFRTEGRWLAQLSLSVSEQEYELEMTWADADELTALIRRHDLNRWNGFDRTDRRMLDGTGFTLNISYEDGQTLSASGSNAFPEGYQEAHKDILRFFDKLMKRNGLENPL